MRRRVLMIAALLFVLGSITCLDVWETLLVTAQVAKTLGPESNTASVLVGKATFENVFESDWLETPVPGDTTFWNDAFPARVTPVGGASVRVNGDAVGERLPGVYFAVRDLEHMARYDLAIETADGKVVTAHGFLPDSFSIAEPATGAELHPDSVRVTWTDSDSAETFLVGVTPADSGSAAEGWADSFTDTTCAVPRAAFADSLGSLVPGEYILTVSAINGGWNRSGLDLLLRGGNLSGAVGVFGCAVVPGPVVFRVTAP